MRYLVLFLLLSLPARAEDITVSIPDNMDPSISVICDQLRVNLGISTLTTQACVESIVRSGVRKIVRYRIRQEASDAAVSNANKKLEDFDNSFPDPASP